VAAIASPDVGRALAWPCLADGGGIVSVNQFLGKAELVMGSTLLGWPKFPHYEPGVFDGPLLEW
jgi:hypothetical protein